ncbi:hypothetical protein BJY01DRAFT_249973 [Aspergillus pseudoustus]|uniref:F-box domain-containing protein n=1 Tax=Aspergillus pseudoustus TaxID=1810923 RepID=A0ABR4JKE6_9EURO
MPDPFQTLSIECASGILEHLSVADIARCEGVSRGWAVFVRQWMVSPGLRLHFQNDIGLSDRCDLKECAWYFKEQAAVQKHIERGEPCAVREYKRAAVFITAGNYCAWVEHKEGIFWQDLSYKPDGSLHPVMKLDAIVVDENLHEQEKFVILGASGHLLVRYRTLPGWTDEEPGVEDALFCLDTGSQLWCRRCHGVEQKYVPMLVGEDRVYFGTVTCGSGPSKLRAYALESGELLYDTETIVPHTNCFSGMDDTRGYRFGHPLEFLRAGKEELILAFKTEVGFRNHMATIWLINGADGSLRQKTRALMIGGPSYVRVSPNRTAFSIISHRAYLPLIKVETFARQSNGEFASTCVDVIDPQTDCQPHLLSLDPFAGCILALEGDPASVHCSRLVEAVDPDTVSRIKVKTPAQLLVSPRGHEDRQLIPIGSCTISLPPRSKRARLRRPFPSRDSRLHHVRFTDGYRAVIQWVDGTIFVLDFAPGRYR